MDIFGANLLEDTSLQETFDKLTGALPEKPFECVGSREEINFALCETVRALQRTGEPLPALLERYPMQCARVEDVLRKLAEE
mgnify:CR=1 FL=1